MVLQAGKVRMGSTYYMPAMETTAAAGVATAGAPDAAAVVVVASPIGAAGASGAGGALIESASSGCHFTVRPIRAIAAMAKATPTPGMGSVDSSVSMPGMKLT